MAVELIPNTDVYSAMEAYSYLAKQKHMFTN